MSGRESLLSSSLFAKAINEAMLLLAEDPRTVFVGQGVVYGGIAMAASLDGVPMSKRVELPVIEDFQMGYCIGLALTGKVPICMFPRFDFVLLAANQLVNHLDKLPRFGWHPKVIIRTAVGSRYPLDAGPQHTQDHTAAFRMMLQSVEVRYCWDAEQASIVYAQALAAEGSTLIVENPQWQR
jgi:pyruvate/2-oxoglutarate/acetoin dehydrogenase E1 component